LCPPNTLPDTTASWARMQVLGTVAARTYGAEPDIAEWANRCALNPARIDTSRRVKHGALLDAELLAEVYLELIEARQAQLGLTAAAAEPAVVAGAEVIVRMRPTPLLPRLSDDERAAHRAFVATLGEKAIWKEYLPAADPTAEPPPVANQA